MTLLFNPDFASIATITGEGGTCVNMTDEVNCVDGHTAGAPGVLMTGTAKLSYPTSGRFNISKGTVEFWFKPTIDYDVLHSANKYFLYAFYGGQTNQNFKLLTNRTADAIQNMLLASFQDGTGLSTYWNWSTEGIEGLMRCTKDIWHKCYIYWDLTLADNASYIIGRIDHFYWTLKTFAAITPDTLGDNKTLWIGQYNGTGVCDCVFSGLKIYDESLLPDVPFPQNFFDPQDDGTTEATFRALFPDGTSAGENPCNPWETNADRPYNCPLLDSGIETGEDVIFFNRPHLEKVYPGYVPTQADIDDSNNPTGSPYTWKVTPGEVETLFFNVYTRDALAAIVATLDTDGFDGPGNIPKSACDLRVVRTWFQGGADNGTSVRPLPAYSAELLMHDDSIEPEKTTDVNQFAAPDIPIQDHVDTSMAAATSKQFALIIRVPSDATPGTYTSTVTLTVSGLPDHTLTLTLIVLPFTLRPHGKRITFTYSPVNLAYFCAADRQALDLWGLIELDMQAMVDMGVNSVTLNNINSAPPYTSTWDIQANSDLWDDTSLCSKGTMNFLDVVENQLAVAQHVGLDYVVIYAGTRPEYIDQEYTEDLVTLMQSYDFEPWLYGRDEFGDNVPSTIAEQVAKSTVIHSVGAKCAAATGWNTCDQYNEDYPSPDDPACCEWETYIISSTNDGTGGSGSYFADLQSGALSPQPEYFQDYYWQIRDGDDRFHRYLVGFFLYLTGLPGSGPSTNFSEGADRWTDWKNNLRAYGVVYPSKQGPVPTHQGQAFREGVRDLKYIATWQYQYDRIKISHPTQASDSQDNINTILDYYKDTTANNRNAGLRRSEADWATDREAIIAEIQTLIGLHTGNYVAGVPSGKVAGKEAAKVAGVVVFT